MTKINVRRDVTGPVANNMFINQFCPGQESCPFERDEAEQQRRFEKNTGIMCSSGARKALQYLLDCGAFNYKELAIAWRASALRWNVDSLTLIANVSRSDLWYGRFVMLFSIFCFVFGLVGVARSRPVSFANVELLTNFFVMCLIGALPFASRHMVQPNQIAQRAAPFLARYYASPS